MNTSAVQALVAAAGPQDWSVQAARVEDVLLPSLFGAPRVPVELVDMALAADDPRWLEALLRDEKTLTRIPGVRQRLAESGHPAVLRVAVVEGGTWSLRLRRTALAAAPPTTPGGIAAEFQALTGIERLRPLVVCPLPGAARRALTNAGDRLTRAERLRALLTVHDHDGGPAALALLGQVPLPPDAAALLGRVVETGDAAPLRAAVEEAEGTAGAVEELRDSELPRRPEHLALRATLDWAVVRAAAKEEPFDSAAAAALVSRPDCPDDLVDLLYTSQAGAVVGHAVRVSASLFRLEPGGQGTAKALSALIRRALAHGIPGPHLIGAVRPGPTLLASLRWRPVTPETAVVEWDAYAAALSVLVADHLGTDVAAWRRIRLRLKGFRGPVAELFAFDGAPAAAADSAPWPEAAAGPGHDREVKVSGARAAFLALLDAAPVASHIALLPHLDDRTVHELFGHGRWRPEWVDFVLAADDPRYRPALARRASLGPEAVDRLLTLDDSEVNAFLYLRSAATERQRERLLSGREGGTGRTGAVPLAPWLLERLLERAGGWQPRDAVDCADLDLQWHILTRVRVRGAAPQRRLLLNLWERHGPEAVRALLTEGPTPSGHTRNVFLPKVKSSVTRLLKDTDAAAALERLRAATTEEESAEWQVAAVRDSGRHHYLDLFKQAHDWHWDALLAAHRSAPLPATGLHLLAKIRGCPDELRRTARRALEPWRFPAYAQLAVGVPAVQVLRDNPMEVDGRWFYWLTDAIRADRVTWADALEHGTPAQVVLYSVLAEGVGDDGVTELSGLLRDTLDGRPEAWVLALRMLPDFPGSVAELLRTAAAATG